MNIYIKNIGIVQESEIQLDGLTVIAGKNNSGKTTVGKVLYSLIDAVSDLQEKANKDRKSYIAKQLRKVQSTLEVLGLYVRPILREEEDHGFDGTALYQLFVNRRQDLESIESFAYELYDELKNFDLNTLKLTEETKRYFRVMIRSRKVGDSSITDALSKQIAEAVQILETTFEDINKDPECIAYAKSSIEHTLLSEFKKQIQPVRNPSAQSEIVLTDEGSICFSLLIEKNRIVNANERVFYTSPYQRTYLIDDPFVLEDSMIMSGPRRTVEYSGNESFLNQNRILPHSGRIKEAIHFETSPSILERTILEESSRQIREKIDAILPGQFEFSLDGSYYIDGGTKLEVSNLATGSKMLSIIKVLLDKGKIDGSTMLILDEPEAHLHPMWQNAFAEIIVLLAKEMNVNILLTTHSPNFMLAIDAYMRKHGFADKTNFYQTETTEDGFVNYKCVNDNMDLIYGDFLQYLSEVKMLRDAYLFGTGEEE